jgi:hypothetical protein
LDPSGLKNPCRSIWSGWPQEPPRLYELVWERTAAAIDRPAPRPHRLLQPEERMEYPARIERGPERLHPLPAVRGEGPRRPGGVDREIRFGDVVPDRVRLEAPHQPVEPPFVLGVVCLIRTDPRPRLTLMPGRYGPGIGAVTSFPITIACSLWGQVRQRLGTAFLLSYPEEAMGRTYRREDGRIWEVAKHRVGRRGLPPLTLSFAEVDGRVECVRLEIGANLENRVEPDPKPLTSSLLRKVNLGQLVAEARRDYLKGIRSLDREAGIDPAILAPHLAAAERSHEVRPGGRARLDRAELELVAEVYLQAHRRREPPTKAVAQAFYLSRTGAAKRVAKARALGLLPKTTKGKAKGRTRRIPPAEES